jgi:hypothetical protein
MSHVICGNTDWTPASAGVTEHFVIPAQAGIQL